MSKIKWISMLSAGALSLGLFPTLASADDFRVKATPAVIRSVDGNSATTQTVRWGYGGGYRRGYYRGGYYGPRYGGYYRSFYRPRFYSGYYAPRYYYPSYGYYYTPSYGYYYY